MIEQRAVTLGEVANLVCPDALKDLPAGYIEEGRLLTSSSVVTHFVEKNREALAHRADLPNEAKVRDALCRAMEEDGWRTATEQYTSQGRIDILAERGDECRVIEVKLSCGSNEMAHALGQLLFYSKFHPSATLWVATPDKLDSDNTVLSILRSFGVSYMEI